MFQKVRNLKIKADQIIHADQVDLSQEGLNAQHHHRAKNQLHHPLLPPHRQEILIHHRQEDPAGIGEVSPQARRTINRDKARLVQQLTVNQ